MIVVESIVAMQEQSLSWKREGLRVGVVPTMGALHDGHLSLVQLLAGHVDRIVVTLFVNPTQFGAGEDFSQYPRTFASDKEKCLSCGVDAVFFPSTAEMYSASNSTFVMEESLSRGLCGQSRPSHFKGVTTVVVKLFNAVWPDVAVFGEKDFQQLQVIKRMVRDLNFPVKILPAPVYREKDGLAMSSRNSYLTPQERLAARSINQSLQLAVSRLKKGETNLADIKKTVVEQIGFSGGQIDYVKIVNSETLEEVSAKTDLPVRVMVAVYYGSTRLIDNMGV